MRSLPASHAKAPGGAKSGHKAVRRACLDAPTIVPGPGVMPRALGFSMLSARDLGLKREDRQATIVAITCALVVVAGSASVLMAQDLTPVVEPDAIIAPAEIDVHPPRPRDAMRAFSLVESWLHALEAPSEEVTILGTRSALVVLRLDSRVIGRGMSLREDGSGVWEAASLAISEAVGRIPTSNDATAQVVRREAANRMTISLELGGRLIPLRANGWNQIDAEVEVAMTAVAAKLSVNDVEMSGATFPSMMRTRGDSPTAGVARAVAEASGNPVLALPSDARSTPRSLREEHGVRLYACRVTHLVQTAPGMAPTFLYRGSRLVPSSEITHDTISRWSMDLARHLSRRYDVLSYDPAAEQQPTMPRAPMAPELAITIRALEQCLALDTMSSEAHDQTVNAIAAMRARLRDGFPKDKAISPINAAAMVLAGLVHDDEPAVQARVDDALAAAVTGTGEWARSIAPASRGFIVWALAERAASHEDASLRRDSLDRADRALRSIYRETRESDLVGQMPWLFFAERRVADDKDSIPAAATLRNVRDLVVRHQLTASDAGDEGLDLIGGVVYTRQGASLPNAQSARAIAFLCALIGDSRVTNADESLRTLTNALSGVRFLRQLTMDEYSGHIASDPQIALGGVQAAAWDPSQPIEASAISLLAACEMLRGLDAMAQMSSTSDTPDASMAPDSTKQRSHTGPAPAHPVGPNSAP